MSSPRTRIIAEARAWIGTPYRHQGSLKGVGCDCLGLVCGVWRALNGAEPEATPAASQDRYRMFWMMDLDMPCPPPDFRTGFFCRPLPC